MIPIFIKLGLLTKRVTQGVRHYAASQSQGSYPHDGSPYGYQYEQYVGAYPQNNFYGGAIGVDTTNPPYTGYQNEGINVYDAFGST